MATDDSTQSAQVMKFTPGGAIYTIPQGTSKKDIHEHLIGRLNQLHAMLVTTNGSGDKGFQKWHSEIQESYLYDLATHGLNESLREIKRPPNDSDNVMAKETSHW